MPRIGPWSFSTHHFKVDIMKLKPLFNHVLVELTPQPTINAAGLTLPESIRNTMPKRGTVIAVGPGRWRDGRFVEPTVKSGDRVILISHHWISELDDNFVIIDDEQVAAIET